MKQLSFIFILLFVILNICACSYQKEQKQKENSIEIDLSHQDEKLALSSFISSVETIKLELPEPYCFGIVTDVLVADSSLFVVDKKQGNIFRFKIDGTFLNKIGNRGEAPGEFNRLHRCFVGNECVYVSDIDTRKIHCYTYSGKYVKLIASSFDLVYDDIVALPNGKFLCHDIQGCIEESKIWLMDENGKKEKTLLYHSAAYPYSYTDWNTISATTSNDELKIFDPITGSFYICEIETGDLKECQHLVSKRKGLNSFEGVELMGNIKEEYAYPSFVIDADNYLYSIWITSDPIGLHALYDKTGKEVHVTTRLDMDFPNYTQFPIPVSTNLPNTIMAVMTNEYPLECFPEQYRDDISEQTAIVYFMKFK